MNAHRAPANLSKSAFWVALEALGGSAFSSFGMLVIAGIIGPHSLGLTAVALGFMEAINFFPQGLFHDAIIQRRRVTSRHLGSAFWSALALSAILSAGTAMLAVPAARFYQQPELAPLLFVLSATPLCVGLASIQTARLRRALRFRQLAACTIISRAVATAGGLTLAVKGGGPWAVIAQYSLSEGLLAVMLLSSSGWRFIRFLRVLT